LTHHASRRFWALYEALPAEVRELADKNYELLQVRPAASVAALQEDRRPVVREFRGTQELIVKIGGW
jgi:hypothetical protein